MDFEVKGEEKLTETELEAINKIINENYEKIKRILKSDFSIRLHIKTYDNEGAKRKYSLNMQVTNNAKKIEATDADWDFARSLHRIIDKIKTQIEHMYKTSEQNKEHGSKKKPLI
jgi:ribosome-associated translation inhibitor RaiA